MNKRNNVTRIVALGTLALAISIPASVGAASAATPATTTTVKTIYTGSYDLNALLQKYFNSLYPSGSQTKPTTSKPTTTTKPTTSKPTTTTPSTSKPSTGTSKGTTTTATSAYAAQVVTLVNQERAKAGLSPLKSTNATLTKMALDKAKDMYNNGYFSHTSPTYGSPFDMMKKYGISYSYAGENIAKGQKTPQEVMTAWMNSAGHKANILSANFTTIGVAYYNGVWVQEFIK
ncbi:CAP domain-containing protein [Cohnella suwonensis]|uniref:CAP domain-containing protein n=1 Tax=Cohnella suwonensis TaxID=696072 RepID=A0ABW0M2F8_9BACL